MRTILRVSLIFLLAFSLPGCVRKPAPTLRMGNIIWAGYDPFYLAREQGWLPPDVRMVDFLANSDVVRAFRTGLLDVALLTLDEALTVAQWDPDVVVLLPLSVSEGADAIIGRAGIGSLADLKGRTVAREPTAVGAYMLHRALESAGLTTGDVKVRDLYSTTHSQAFDDPEIDAVVTFEPMAGALRDLGGTQLFDSRSLPGEIVDVLLVRRALLDSRRETLRRMVAAWYRGVQFLRVSPARAHGLLERRRGTPIGDAEDAFGTIRFFDPPESLGAFDPTSPAPLSVTAERVQTFMLNRGLLHHPAQLDRFIPHRDEVREVYP